MDLDIATLVQALVFVVAFGTTVVILSDSEDGAERESIFRGLRAIGKMILGRIDPPVEKPRVPGRLSDETWQRLLHAHMANAAPDRRVWFR